MAATGLFGSVSAGGDPKTDHASSICLVGGDPRTDLSVQSNACVGADSPHPGGLATQTATPVSPACTVLGVSTAFTHDSEVRDECPSSAEVSVHHDGLTTILQDPDHRDGCPSSAELSEGRDGFPRPGDTEYSDTVFLRDFHADENSERVRQSDSGVQIVPASRSPSELSAQKMGLPLAGTIRLKSEPVGLESTGTLDIGESVQLSISDRALLRKYKSSGRVEENSQQAGRYKQENSTSVSRVDGHPPKQSLSLYDRMLLRKYPDAGTKSTLSPSSILVSSPPVVHPVESVKKKRRRFYGKGNSNRANTGAVARNEESLDQESSPCGFLSKVAELPVHPGCITSPSIQVSDSMDFTLLYETLVMDNAVPLGYLQDFRSLETPARRAVKRLQSSAASVSDSMASAALVALRRESDHRTAEAGTIADQFVAEKSFVRSGSVRSTTGPQLERTRKLRNEIDGFNSSRICSGQRTRQWGN